MAEGFEISPAESTCFHPGCAARPVGEYDSCLEHITPDHFEDWLATLRPGVNLDLRGNRIDPAQMTAILVACRPEGTAPRWAEIGAANLVGARFIGPSKLNIRFSGNVNLNRARFDEGVDLYEAQFRGDLLELQGAEFFGPVRLYIDSGRVRLKGAYFKSGASLELHLTSVIEITDLRSSEIISIAGAPLGSARTVLLGSLNNVDASRLVLTDLDLSRCEFAGAHNLDQIHLAGCTFPVFAGPVYTTDGVRWRRKYPWITRRRYVLDEGLWRGRNEPRELPSPPDAPGLPVTAERVSVIYRQLRKAQEDAKNEPGAADFYYGEMEMRRLSNESPLSERLILTAYGALSGYGLRATRAFGWLVVAILLAALVLAWIGFTDRPSFAHTLLFAAQSTVSLEPKLPSLAHPTIWGEVIRIVLRITGPLLLGLGLLAIRNRVKR